MNQAVKIILIAAVVFVALGAVGHSLFISPVERELARLQDTVSQKDAEQRALEAQLAAPTKENPLARRPRGPQTLLAIGEEGVAATRIYEAASASGALLERFEVLPPFRLAPKEDEDSPAAAAPTIREGALPALDENGMPVGAMAADDEAPKGMEILPVRFRLRGTFRSIGEFLSRLDRTLPLFGLRALRLEFAESGIGKGQLEVVLPLHQAGNRPAASPAGH